MVLNEPPEDTQRRGTKCGEGVNTESPSPPQRLTFSRKNSPPKCSISTLMKAKEFTVAL